MSWSAGMHLNVETKGLGEMSDLHRPGNTQVILRVSPQNVGTAIDNEISLRLKTADVFGAKDGSLNQLAKLPMRKL
jgi:hypothetical protein